MSHIHPLAWAYVKAERQSALRNTPEAIARAWEARRDWIMEGMPLLEGESHGSSPPDLTERVGSPAKPPE